MNKKIILYLGLFIATNIMSCSMLTINLDQAVKFLKKNEPELIKIDSGFRKIKNLQIIDLYGGDLPDKLQKKYKYKTDLLIYDFFYKNLHYYLITTKSELYEISIDMIESSSDSLKKFSDFLKDDSFDFQELKTIILTINSLGIEKIVKTTNWRYTEFYLSNLAGLVYKYDDYPTITGLSHYSESQKINEHWYYFKDRF